MDDWKFKQNLFDVKLFDSTIFVMDEINVHIVFSKTQVWVYSIVPCVL